MAARIRSLGIVTPFYPPHVGGVERYAQEFARAAADLGLRVRVVSTGPVKRPVVSDDAGIAVLTLPAYAVPVMGSHYPIPLRGWGAAAEFLRCDIVVAHTRFFLTTLIATGLLALRGKRTCIVDHGSGPLRAEPKVLALLALAYEHAVTAGLKLVSPRFFAVSTASAQWIRRFGIHDAPVISNSVAARTAPPLRQPHRKGERVVIFYAGRLFAEKGVLELIDGVELLRRNGLDIELRIAGDGPLAPRLARRAASENGLTYLGRIHPEQVAAELERATVFVHPSKLPEGFPTLLLEAGSTALPVISTPFGGSAEIITDGETGWIIPHAEPRIIAASLVTVLSDPAEALRRGSALYRHVQRHFTWPSTVARFLRQAEGLGATVRST